MSRFLPLLFTLLFVWLSGISTINNSYAAIADSANTESGSVWCTAQVESVEVAKAVGTNGIQRPQQGWQKTTLPDRWETRWHDYTGSAWYKIIWQYHCPSHQKTPVSLVINSINMAGQIYINNELLWQDQSLVEPLSRSWNMPRQWQLPASILKDGENILWVRVVGVAWQQPGLGKTMLAPLPLAAQHFEKFWYEQRVLHFFNLTFSLTLGLLAFLVWLFHREEKAFGWFALTSLLWVLFIYNVVMVHTPFGLSTLQIARINMVLLFAYGVCACLYAWRFAHQYFPRIERLLFSLLFLVVINAIFTPDEYIYYFLTGSFSVATLILLINFLTFPWIAYRTRQPESYLLAVVFIFYLLIALHDLYFVVVKPDISPLTPYTAPLTTLAIAIILAWRLAKNARHIQKFNQTLKHEIDSARKELSLSLNNQHQLALKNTKLQERIHLAHDLHDGLGGSLVRAMLMVDQNHTKLSNQQFLSILKLLRDDLRQVIDSGSSMGAKLPDSPILWGAPVRHRFIQLFDELDIQSSWNFPPQWQTKPTPLQCLTLLRVAEEALTNIIKHSQANNVRMNLYYSRPYQLVLEIEDNGVGFDVEAIQQSNMSIGLRSMQIRVQRIGGQLDIVSQAGRTCLMVILPLTSEQPAH